MSKLKSELGSAIERVFSLQKRGTGTEIFVLQGWKKSPHTFYLDDVYDVYQRLTDWIRNEEQFVLFAVASRANGFRRNYLFMQDGHEYCGLLFSRWYGSFMFVFGIDGRRTAELYYMGVSYASNESQMEDITAYCSRMSTDFAALIETEYFDLRDSIVGRFGIQKATL